MVCGTWTFCLVSQCSSHISQATEGKGRDWEKEKVPTVGEDQVQEHLRKTKGGQVHGT